VRTSFAATLSVLSLAVASVLSGCGDATPPLGTSGTIALRSPAFAPLGEIPKKHARLGEGDNVSPPLTWSNVPAGTKELVVFVDDPDAETAGAQTLWIVYGIPAGATGLPEGISPEPAVLKAPEGAIQGKNSLGQIGYAGPFPPPGKKHRLAFWIHALDTRLGLVVGVDRPAVEAAMKSHVIGHGRFVATYGGS
jgi:Raf kinase inhibitor-like YbhB/YbcL family protein